jgi:hypothetical protein
MRLTLTILAIATIFLALSARAKAPRGEVANHNDPFLTPIYTPTPSKTPVVSRGIYSSDTDALVSYIRAVFGDQSDRALAIVKCESGFKPRAINWGDASITGQPSCGYFQHNDARCRDDNSIIWDMHYQVDLAKEKFDKRGWVPWTNCAKKNGFL